MSDDGATLVNMAFGGTGAFVAITVAAQLLPDPLAVVMAALSLGLFVAGCAAFLWAYATGVVRSRDESLSVFGLFFLAGEAAPATVRWQLRGVLVVQILVAVIAASLRPFTEAAFGVLVPVFGLGLMGLWGARHGTFPAKSER